jgi:hypothetical protein
VAISSNLVTMEATNVSAPHEGRRHLQRLIRKVKHVLVVKHYIDDLKGGVGLRQCRGVLLQRTYVHFHPFPIHSNLSIVATSILSFNLRSHDLDATMCMKAIQVVIRLSSSRHTNKFKGMTFSMNCPMGLQLLQVSANWTLLLMHSTAMTRLPRYRVLKMIHGRSP